MTARLQDSARQHTREQTFDKLDIGPLANLPRCPRLVVANQARIANDVDGHDRGKSAAFGRRVSQTGLS
jgi:hypothetical protein